ncbi:maleylpyruvate isomerase family mycothiol-dependent enzyme [Cellulomonas fengjieae]|uniref:Maleylpyruvate isomerase family mycothiol-dependent enzyme n=1 Tax=Cellulomonas fengjieae TaxID=2819978 RepID=A0ABS3SGA9_9CELL|nr:maleylpyruvate isomerase family mycothiol-dependent enzyme [Cellulomonas fengjieae]MBO3083990.1 maleylpyruvate isomerase family mycothiol-dependent enzyme [Cellulomonas fengjieae]QVI64743.1 maleylpyruvate isomerase family mycothiol-dependent enzyme [Cellulomonas fengjieae]
MTTDRADAPPDLLSVLGALQADFLATIPLVDPTTPVPWCGRWRVRNLVVHLARIHHWAAGQARRRQETPLGRGPFDLEDLYATCAAELHDTLTALGPDTPAWTLDDTGTASFWHRRQTHETLVHLWDLRTAGRLDLAAAPTLWADTVDEVVTVLQPRQERMGRMDALPAPVALVAPDVDRTWLLGATSRVDPAVTVSGPAAALALLLWGRTTPQDDRLSTTGDGAALREALGRRLTP